MKIIDPRVYKEWRNCFSLFIPVCEDEEEFKALLSDAEKVSQATKQMLDGSINVEELLEIVETFLPSIDEYVEEIEDNMEEALVKIYKY